MGITTITGLALSLIFIIWAIISKGGPNTIKVFLDLGSFVLVFGCSISALLVNYTLNEITSSAKAIKYCFKTKPTLPEKIIEMLVKMAVKARKEGFLSLSQEADKTKIEILSLGTSLLADGTDPQATRDILEIAADAEASTLAQNEQLWRDMGVYAPMFGMLGTLIGLVLMLRSLSDPSAIGPAMALALVTTFYGVFLAGVLCLPVAGKIHNYGGRVALNRTLIIEGLLSIQGGDNSRIVEEKLKAYLSKEK